MVFGYCIMSQAVRVLVVVGLLYLPLHVIIIVVFIIINITVITFIIT